MLPFICVIAIISSLFYSFSTKEKSTGQEKDPLHAIKAHPLLHAADSLQKAGQTEQSLAFLKKGLKTFEKQQDQNHYLFTLNRLAEVLIRQKLADSALYYLRPFQRAENPETSTGKTLQAHLYYQLGNAYDLKYVINSALHWHKKALDLRMSLPGTNALDIAKSCGQIGNIYRYKKNDFFNAEKYYTKQLNLLKNIPGYHYMKASCYYNLAATYDLKYDFENALTYSYKALEKADDLGGDSAVWFREYCYLAIGHAYDSKKEYKKAANYYRKSIRSVESRKGSDDLSLTDHYYNLGMVYFSISKEDSARFCADKVLNILLPIFESRPNSLLRNKIINCYILKGMGVNNRFDKSLDYYNKALAYIENNDYDLTRVYLKIGRLYSDHNMLDSALHYFQKALFGKKEISDSLFTNPSSAHFKDNRNYLAALIEKAKVLKNKYNTSSQFEYLTASYSAYLLIDSVFYNYKLSFQREGSKIFMAEFNQFNYEYGLDCIHELTKSNQQKKTFFLGSALNFMERSKYSVLLENLTKAEFKNTAGIPADIKEQENNLVTELAFLQGKLNNANDDSTTTTIQNKMYRITKKQDSLIAFFKEHYPNYFQYKYADHIISLLEAQKEAQNKDAILLEYFWGDHAIYGLAIYKNGYRFVRIEKTQLLQDQLRAFQEQLSAGINMNSLREDFEVYTNSGFSLYEQLVQPLLHGRDENTIVIIPHGPLSYLPFEALLTRVPVDQKVNYKNLDYLTKEYSISYAYSLSLLHNQTKEIDKKGEEQIVLALGYGGDANQPANLQVKRNNNLQDLPGSVQELQAISKLMKGQFLSGTEATESAFRKNIAQSAIIHLALHNVNDTLNPLNSKLVFRKEADSQEDGFLHTYELYNLNLKGKLAVLSACESGIGKMEAGEGINSIGRGFTYAGCSAVLFSLWKIQDESSAKFMKSFYKQLQNHQHTGTALHKTHLSYLENADELTAHPSNWAAFVLYGNTELAHEATDQNLWLPGILAVILLIALYLLNRKSVRIKLPGKST